VGMGAEGVSFYLNHLKKEIETAMILTGCASIGEIHPEIIQAV
ncbi:MAG: alpha-hydroxy-acid oxidizing protein, partial [Chrysiogenales bacterium]